MIPILYDKTETLFASNGLGRLRDCISAVVTEERNGVYELDFEYPMSAEDFDQIQIGRIVGVTHDDTDDAQPFDIVSYSRPINGVVTFHCVHISYRQSYMTVTGSNINSLADAFTLLSTAEPDNPFTYWTDKDSTGYMASADGTPRSVRQMLGGVEGSILDAYGGEYEWDKFLVKLHDSRGQLRNFSIRYGVNMLDYKEDYDSQGTYSSCIPYWTDGETKVVGDRQDSPTATITGRGECVPMDVSDKFEAQPTKAEVEAMGLSMLTSKNTALPTQNIHVEFVRLQDLGYEGLGSLLKCKLCDTVNVIFPDYNATGQFKIVKTVWNVLKDRYDSMELGDLSITLSEALGVGSGGSTYVSGGGGETADDYVVEHGTNGIWTYRKWNSGIAECWGTRENVSTSFTAWTNGWYYAYFSGQNFPFTFTDIPVITQHCSSAGNDIYATGASIGNFGGLASTTNTGGTTLYRAGSGTVSVTVRYYAIGKWK